MKSLTKSIIFDLGGVLVPEAGSLIEKIIASQLDISLEKLEGLSADLKLRATIGEITLLAFYEQIILRANSQINSVRLLNLHLFEYERTSTLRDSKILNLFEEIKNRGHNLACLTNTEIEIAQFNRERGLFDYFGKYAFLSTEMKKRKPQPEIYLEVAEKMNCLTREYVFIDDKLEYVESAIKTGMRGIVYKNAEQLVKELKKYEVNLK
ncbi:MAG: HAD-IA family hydrolase [Nanoarchaeota archaeon]